MFFIRCIEAKRREDMSRRALVDALESALLKFKSSFLSRMSRHSHAAQRHHRLYGDRQETCHRRRKIEARPSDVLKRQNSASRHLLTILNRVLDMASIRSGRVKIADVPFDLSGLLSSSKAFFSHTGEGKWSFLCGGKGRCGTAPYGRFHEAGSDTDEPSLQHSEIH